MTGNLTNNYATWRIDILSSLVLLIRASHSFFSFALAKFEKMPVLTSFIPNHRLNMLPVMNANFCSGSLQNSNICTPSAANGVAMDMPDCGWLCTTMSV